MLCSMDSADIECFLDLDVQVLRNPPQTQGAAGPNRGALDVRVRL